MLTRAAVERAHRDVFDVCNQVGREELRDIVGASGGGVCTMLRLVSYHSSTRGECLARVWDIIIKISAAQQKALMQDGGWPDVPRLPVSSLVALASEVSSVRVGSRQETGDVASTVLNHGRRAPSWTKHDLTGCLHVASRTSTCFGEVSFCRVSKKNKQRATGV